MEYKYSTLIDYIKSYKHVAVAFSGGVDSSFLLAACKEAIGENVIAITIDTPAIPRHELEEAKEIAKLLKIHHLIIKDDKIEESIKHNPIDRCYYCKRIEFKKIIDEAKKQGISIVFDGSNTDDNSDYRPGKKAIRELEIISPLAEMGFTKNDIRHYSKLLNLPTWDKPAYACLYSRIPYNHEIKKSDLKKIELSEKFLIDKGFRNVRVRCHDNLARIEVNPSDRIKLLSEPLATEINSTLKKFGFDYISVDIIGYRTGSFNETIL